MAKKGRGAQGGGGTPPQPSPPPEQVPQVPILKEVTYDSQETDAHREGEGLRLRFVVIEAGQPIWLTLLVSKPGKEKIESVVNGGLEIARVVPPEARA